MLARARKKMRSLFFEGEVLRLMSLAVLTKPIGLVSQILMAKYYGAGTHYDGYILALFLISFLTNTISRVFHAVTIPFLADQRDKIGQKELSALINALVAICMIPQAALAFVLVFKSGWLVALAAPNAPEETKQFTVQMLRMMAIPSILATLVETMKAVLNAHSAFRMPAISPIINSAVMLAMLVATHESLGIWALPAAFIASNFLQAAILVWHAGTRKVLLPVRPRASTEVLQRLWRRSWMVLVATIILVANSFVDKFFASGLDSGSISAVAYANTITNLGMQIFQFSLVTVMFTKLSEDLAKDRIGACNSYLDTNLRRMARIVVPACLAIGVASTEVVQVLFQRDAFSATDSARTAGALYMYMLGLPAYLINLVVASVYHAMKQLGDKVWLAVQHLVTCVIGNLLLVGPLGVTGLAISSTLAINIHLALSAYFLSRSKVGLAVGPISRGVLVHYGLGAAAWTVYQISGARNMLDSVHTDHNRGITALVGAGRAAVILFAYFLLMLLQRRLSKRRGLLRLHQ
jgi:putative peptidoglycan lipid II flippase